VQRAVALREQAAVSAVAEIRGGGGDRREDDARHRDRAREHRADRQQRALRAVLADDQHDDQREPADSSADGADLEELVREQLRGAEERGDRSGGRSAMGSGLRGARASAGGVSSKVRSASSERRAEIPAMTQNSGRQASASRLQPADGGPSVTAPKMHMLMITAVERNFSTPKPSASGGTRDQQEARAEALQHVAAMNIAGFCAAAARTDPITSSET
jgi:hypothetical protein